MPTSDAATAMAALERFSRASFKSLLLHSPPNASSSAPLSDLDLVVSGKLTKEFLSRLEAEILRPIGLMPIIAWDYDYASMAVFAISPDGNRGLHLDFVCDVRGWCRLGIKLASFLSGPTGQRAGSWLAADPIDQCIYLIRKHHWKKRYMSLAQHVARAEGYGSHLTDRAADVLNRRACRNALELLGASNLQEVRFRKPFINRVVAARRLLGRAMTPIGAWIHFAGENVEYLAVEVSRRLDKIIIEAACLPLEGPLVSSAKTLWNVAHARWRAAVTITYGRGTIAFPRPDAQLYVKGAGIEYLMQRVTALLHYRLMGAPNMARG